MMYKFLLLVSSIIVSLGFSWCDDWTHFQHDAQRTGRSPDNVGPPYTQRWNWTGGATIACGVQPIIVGGRVYIGNMNGTVYAINATNGQQVWSASNPGGTVVSGCYANNKVVFCSITGVIRCYDANTGTLQLEYPTDGAITGAPATNGTVVVVGSHDGHVYAVNLSNGQLAWISPDLGAQVVQAPALDNDTVYVGAENMTVYALNLSNGQIRASKHVQGQSFYQVWPVVYSSYVFIEAAPIPCIGSEWVGETVMSSATSISDEQDRWLQFITAITPGYFDSSPDWKHLTVLRRNDLSEPFIVPCAPFEGCGQPPECPVVDNQGRVLTYFKTKYPKLTQAGARTEPIGGGSQFGTNYALDISAIDLATGRRVVIDNGQLSGMSNMQTDNAFGLSVGGDQLFFINDWFGYETINLKTSAFSTLPDPGSAGPYRSARVGPAISGTGVFYPHSSGVMCAE